MGVWAFGRLGVWGWMGRRDRGRLTILVSSTSRFLDSWLRRNLHTTHHRAATRLPTAPRLQRKTPIPPYISRSHSASSLLPPRLLDSSFHDSGGYRHPPQSTRAAPSPHSTPSPTKNSHTPKPPYISRSHSASSLLRSSIPRLLTSQPNAPPPNRAAPKPTLTPTAGATRPRQGHRPDCR